ncbi:DUF1634 domain-containing protein [Flavobacterium sp. WLB]|uniref:DUF1634 domain-containing protein n=1 Tax=unclassified Flavobacterium TaxID=196869 RepID=UPI0009EBEA63|nr:MULTISPECIES: DUF1634 domain-containing protein [unclassified Flavobacterium]PUU71000.1 DUF1634 domain-containing protein [Flavobacterium sp. WLB]
MEKSKVMTHEKFGEKDFQTIIGNLLRYGVWISLSVAFIGGIVYLMHHGNDIEDYSVFKENDRNIFEVITSVVNGVISGSGEFLIFFGIILLFLTPVFRVLLSLFSFLIEKDYLYVVITLIVILIIITSISFGFSH